MSRDGLALILLARAREEETARRRQHQFAEAVRQQRAAESWRWDQWAGQYLRNSVARQRHRHENRLRVEGNTLLEYFTYTNKYGQAREIVDQCARHNPDVDKARVMEILTRRWTEPYRSRCRFDAREAFFVQMSPTAALAAIQTLPARWPY